MLGVEQIVWLGDGIVGDDTDGHVDDLTRFVAADTVVTVVEDEPARRQSRAARRQPRAAADVRLPDGRALRVIELPMPAPVSGTATAPARELREFLHRQPQSSLVPVFEDPADDARAIDVLAQAAFPAGASCRSTAGSWSSASAHSTA